MGSNPTVSCVFFHFNFESIYKIEVSTDRDVYTSTRSVFNHGLGAGAAPKFIMVYLGVISSAESKYDFGLR